MDLIIKGGRIVTTEGSYKGDIGIEKGKIKAIADKLPQNSGKSIDARGMVVFPGAIDVHVHLQLPFCGTVSADDFENGTKAAACGGLCFCRLLTPRGGSLPPALGPKLSPR